MPRLRLEYARRKLHAGVVLVSKECVLDDDISEDVVRETRLDALDEILVVDHAGHGVLADGHGDRTTIDPSLVARGQLEESVRSQRDLDERGLVASITNDVLKHVARNRTHAALAGRGIE